MLMKNVPVLPEVLPSQTLDAVAFRGFSHLTRNRNSEATAAKIVFAKRCNEMPVLEPLPDF